MEAFHGVIIFLGETADLLGVRLAVEGSRIQIGERNEDVVKSKVPSIADVWVTLTKGNISKVARAGIEFAARVGNCGSQGKQVLMSKVLKKLMTVGSLDEVNAASNANRTLISSWVRFVFWAKKLAACRRS